MALNEHKMKLPAASSEASSSDGLNITTQNDEKLNPQTLRIIFAGTPNVSAKLLGDLIENKYNIIACYTQPDRPKGRKQSIEPSAVKKLATQNNIMVRQPENFKSQEIIEELRLLNPDVMLVFAYGLILPKEVITIPKFGCINVHTSLLPRWRGAAPVQHAILAGDQTTGITIMQIDPGLDSGNILHTEECLIAPRETSASLYEKLQPLATQATFKVLTQLSEGIIKSVPQNHKLATYSPKIDKSLAKIDWRNDSYQTDRLIRALIPKPIAFTNLSKSDLIQEITNNPNEPLASSLLKFVQNLSNTNLIAIKIYQATTVNNYFGSNYNHTSSEICAVSGTIIGISNFGIDVITGESTEKLLSSKNICDGVLRIEKLQLPGSKILSITDILNTPKYKFLFKLGRKFV